MRSRLLRSLLVVVCAGVLWGVPGASAQGASTLDPLAAKASRTSGWSHVIISTPAPASVGARVRALGGDAGRLLPIIGASTAMAVFGR